MALLGTYFWILMNTQYIGVSIVFPLILVLGGILFAASAFGFVSANTRSSRVALTMLTGILGGIHVYLLFTMLDLIAGIILFALMAMGLLIAFAAFSWLNE